MLVVPYNAGHFVFLCLGDEVFAPLVACIVVALVGAAAFAYYDIDAVLDVLIIYLIHEIVNRLFAVVGKLAGGVFAAHRKVIRGVGVDGKKYLFGWVARKLISVVDC